MAKHSVDDIRNIALAGHGASGKTSLADALLFHAKAVDRRGSVDEGSSVSDFDEEEKKRHFSIDTSVLHLDYKGKHVYLLDTPGYPDFVGAALAALNAVENAALVVSAPNGIQVNTRRMFKEAGKRELARLVVVNKLDADTVTRALGSDDAALKEAVWWIAGRHPEWGDALVGAFRKRLAGVKALTQTQRDDLAGQLGRFAGTAAVQVRAVLPPSSRAFVTSG